jgi:hypothetical protein
MSSHRGEIIVFVVLSVKRKRGTRWIVWKLPSP